MQDKLKVQKTIDIDFEISVKDLAEAFALGTDFKQFTFLNFDDLRTSNTFSEIFL